MKILIYSLKNGESGAGRIHLEGVLGNLHNMGHSIVYLEGKRYSPTPVKEIQIRGEQRRTVWEQIKEFMAATPLRGEALVLWFIFHEVRIFLSAVMTILRHRPDVIYRRHPLLNSDYLLARAFHIPSVREVNGIVADEIKISKRADNIMIRVINWIEKLTIPKADKVIAVTPRMKELLQSEYGVPSNRISMVQNGADTDSFTPMNPVMARETLGLAQDINYVGFVGSLTRWQGIEYLIQSLPLVIKQCPNARLLIVGDGRMRRELFELAEKTGSSNKIIFTGTVPYHEVPLYINAMDICVASFRKERNERCGLSPLKLSEYMACGKAIVGSRLSGLEVLEQQNAGILVEPENVPELAAAIISLLQNNELRMQMGNNGRRYVVKYHSWKSVAGRVAEVFSEVRRARTEEK